jgi:hypothetical protein
MAARIARSPVLSAARPQLVHEGDFRHFAGANYSVAANGGRVLRLRPAGSSGQEQLIAIRFGWQEDLARVAPPADGGE